MLCLNAVMVDHLFLCALVKGKQQKDKFEIQAHYVKYFPNVFHQGSERRKELNPLKMLDDLE